MGNALKMTRQQISVAAYGHGKLEMTKKNEELLSKISSFVMSFPEKYPRESQIKFNQPLTWETNLHSDLLSSYLVKKEDNVFELKDSSNEDSMLTVKFNHPIIEIKAYTFKALSFVLHLSREFSLFETKTCLESNMDPIGNILGATFSEEYQENTANSVSSYMDYALCSSDSSVASEKKLNFLKFIMILKEFDFSLLKSTLRNISDDLKLKPQDVEEQFAMLKSVVASQSSEPVLENISWLSPFFFVFKNGCRAPLWRQLYGDIAYIVVAPVQAPNLFITANTSGFFLNKRDGFMHRNDSDFERSSDLFDSLIHLIGHFNENFKNNIDEAIVNSRLDSMMKKESVKTCSKEFGQTVSRLEKVLDIEPVCFDNDEFYNEADASEEVKEEEMEEKRETLQVASSVHKKNTQPKSVAILEKRKAKKKNEKKCSTDELVDNPEMNAWIEEASTDGSDSGEDSDRDGPREKTVYNFVVKPRDPKFASYWHIQNMFQFIKSGGRSLTLIGLCSIMDFELDQEKTAISILEANGVEILVNILELDDFQCQICSLKILIGISHYRPIWQTIVKFGGIEIMINLLQHTNISVRCLAAECIGAVAKTALARQLVRKKGGLFKLITFMDSYVTKKEFIFGKGQSFYPTLPLKKLASLESGPILLFLEKQWMKSVEMAKSAAIVIAALANSKRARKMMQKSNMIPFLARLLTSKDVIFLRSLVAILAEFAKEPLYRSSILSEGMVPPAMHLLNYDDDILFERICKFLYRGAVDKRIRDVVKDTEELGLVKKALENSSKSTSLLVAATGAVSKLCLSPSIVKVYAKMGIISFLIGYIDHENIKITLNVLAALIEILKTPANRLEFNRNNGLNILLSKLNHSNYLVLVCVNLALAQCAQEESLINTIIENDGVRLLWSLLLHTDDEVKASAAWAIAPCIEKAQDSGYMVRSLVGGLEVLVKLLNSDNINVLAAVCATIVNVVQDEENIGILTEFKVCHLLSKVLCAQNHENINLLRANVSKAIAQCCRFRDNRVTFGHLDVIKHLVSFLSIDDIAIQNAAAQALFQLSLDADNIVRMHSEGCVMPLLKLIGSHDASVQEAAAHCVSNIRNLTFANRLAKMKNISVG